MCTFTQCMYLDCRVRCNTGLGNKAKSESDAVTAPSLRCTVVDVKTKQRMW